MVPIAFTKEDFKVWDYPYSDVFVVTVNVAGYTLHNILINTASLANILFIKPFNSMGMDK